MVMVVMVVMTDQLMMVNCFSYENSLENDYYDFLIRAGKHDARGVPFSTDQLISRDFLIFNFL